MKGREHVPQLAVDGTVVRAGEIESYCDDEFYHALALWQTTKVLGNPNGAVGWANEPSDFVETFMALEYEDNAVTAEQMEKDRKKVSKGPPPSSNKPIRKKGKK